MSLAPHCAIPCHVDDDDSTHLLPQSISLSSQLSLPSLRSLDSCAETLPYSLHRCIATLRAHSSYVSAIAVHGESVYSGSPDQEIRLWPCVHLDSASSSSSSTPRTDHLTSLTVAAAKSPVKSLVVAGDNLFSSHQDGKICVWQINRSERQHCKLKAVLPTQKDRFLSLLVPENYVQVRRHKKRTWVHHVDAVSSLAVSHDGALLYSVSWDRALKVWRTSDFKCMESVAGAHQDAINAVAVSRDGHVYTGSADARINVWRRGGDGGTKHSLVQTLERHRSAVNALALSADGSVLYSGACDRSVVVWEGGGGRMEATGALRGHRRAILCLAAVGRVVCSGSADRTVRVWKRGVLQKGCYWCLAVLEGHGGPIKSLTAAPVVDERSRRGSSSSSSCLVLSGDLEGEIKVWRVSIPHPPPPPVEGIFC
ncbi:WD domain, G-beta repeat [Musa troglodytarum]|uniref:WD domain, G-beta repeat n=1 Tax=Musa troglodytarum TaxID=320322 RepID=A0A9E7GUH1_9LILI|nr:WD domain, G-beta repeat [Musa troglodytarum]